MVLVSAFGDILTHYILQLVSIVIAYIVSGYPTTLVQQMIIKIQARIERIYE